jgi:glycosyltransferase involved in cell wall biosynthesis
MRFSIVTVSFNQARFLEETIRSILDQDYSDIEYIVVDPGSTDGSREIIERYRGKISKIILEPDRGAADGLNKGFSEASGDIFGFVNSDDILLPGAVSSVAAHFRAQPETDILMGHEWVIDSEGRRLRITYTDRFNLRAFAYSGGVIAQQSTFFRSALFRKTKGFDVHNKIAWDAELFLDLLLASEKQLYVDEFFSAFRVHNESINGGRRAELRDLRCAYEMARFERIMGRPWRTSDSAIRLFYTIRKYVLEPRALVERLRYGSIG